MGLASLLEFVVGDTPARESATNGAGQSVSVDV